MSHPDARRPTPRSPRRAATPRLPEEDLGERDPLGRMALFSDAEPQPDPGPLVITCSSCLKSTPVSAVDVVKAALPVSLHLPFIRRYHSLMRCPACGRRTWVSVGFRREPDQGSL